MVMMMMSTIVMMLMVMSTMVMMMMVMMRMTKLMMVMVIFYLSPNTLHHLLKFGTPETLIVARVGYLQVFR